MEIGILAIIVIVVLVGTSIVGGRLGIAAPLLLVLIGIGIGYLPITPAVRVDPSVILYGVLPPLLYSAAVSTPIIDFRRNFKPIAGLSVVLVIISALVIGALLHLLIPDIPFAIAVALGAVISPTDAVAATSIGKRLGMPERVVSVLEGESLVNDATSLVLLKTALAAVAGSFAFWGSVGSFVYSVVAAIIVGLLIGFVTVWIRSHFKNPVYDTVVSFVVPFLAFIPAELLQASGVLAVVVTGLYTGHRAARKFSAIARVNERINWRTLQFVIENGVFLIMGLELYALIGEATRDSTQLAHLPLIALALVVILIVVRGLFMVPLLASLRSNLRRYRSRFDDRSAAAAELRGRHDADPEELRRATRRAQRTRADLAHEKDQPLGWRAGVALSWSGMRGVVTLAAAQSIPTSVPYRAQIVLLAFFVAIITLLLHGLTLPTLIRRLWPSGSGSNDNREELAALGRELSEVGDAALDHAVEEAVDAIDSQESTRPPTPAEIIERVRADSHEVLAPVATPLPETGLINTVTPETPTEAYLRLTRIVLNAQRQLLLEERSIGRYSSAALRSAELAIDAQEARLRPLR
ncbi:MAG: sodium:proton antiporter [Leucobacter sp.]